MGVGRTDIKEKSQIKDVMVASKQQTAEVNTNVQEVSSQSKQETRNIDMVRESVKLAMPNVYDKLTEMRQGEGEAQGEKTLHHARGTQLLKEGKTVLNLDLIGTNFQEAKKPWVQVRSDQNNFKMKYNIEDNEEVNGEKTKRDVAQLREDLFRLSRNYLGNLFESWQNPGEATDVHILLNGNGQAGAATVEGAMMLKYWVYTNYPQYLKYLKFEITQYNPALSQEEKDLHSDIDLSGNETCDLGVRGAMELGENAETTVIYSLTDAQSSVPQVVKGAKRLILTSLDSKVGLDALNQPVKEGEQKAAFTDARTGETYRGSGLNELEEGVYLLDQNRTLIRVNSPEQAMYLLGVMENQNGKQSERVKQLTSLMKSWFDEKVSEEEVKASEKRSLLIAHRRTEKKNGQTVCIDDSQMMLDVKNRLMELQNYLGMSVKTGDPETELQNIEEQYQELIQNCNTYESHKHPFSKAGRERKKLVRSVRERAEAVRAKLKDAETRERLKQQLSELHGKTISRNVFLYKAGVLDVEQTVSNDTKEAEKQTDQKPVKKKNRLSTQGMKYIRHSDVWHSDEDKSRRLQHSRLWKQCLLDIGNLSAETNEEKRTALGEVLEAMRNYLYSDLAGLVEADAELDYKKASKALNDYLQKYPEDQERLRQYSSFFLLKTNGNLPQGTLEDKKEDGAEYINATENEEELLVGKKFRHDLSAKWVDMTEEPLFWREPSPHDVCQGKLGDCYWLGAIASLAEKDPAKIKECMRDNGDGTVTVRFFKPIGESWKRTFCPLYVTVRKSVARFEGSDKDAFASGRHLWVQMMEKAFAASGLAAVAGKSRLENYNEKDDVFGREDVNAIYQSCKEYIKNHAKDEISDSKQVREKALEIMKKSYAFVDLGSASEENLSFLTGKPAEIEVLRGVDFKQFGEKDDKNLGRWKSGIWSALGEAYKKEKNYDKAHADIAVELEKMIHDEIVSVVCYKGRRSVATIEEARRAAITVIEEIKKDPGRKKVLMDKLKKQKGVTKKSVDHVLNNFPDYFQLALDALDYTHEAFATMQMEDLNDGKPFIVYTRKAERLYRIIKDALSRPNGIVTAASRKLPLKQDSDKSANNPKEYLDEGLRPGHQYSLVGCAEENGYKYVLLRNPWGYRISQAVKVTDADGKETIRHYKTDNEEGTDGMFYLELNSFLTQFQCMAYTRN